MVAELYMVHDILVLHHRHTNQHMGLGHQEKVEKFHF